MKSVHMCLASTGLPVHMCLARTTWGSSTGVGTVHPHMLTQTQCMFT